MLAVSQRSLRGTGNGPGGIVTPLGMGRSRLAIRPHPQMTSARTVTLYQAITRANLLANLKLCLDAADRASYAGNDAQSWLDRSGGGYDFLRGVNGSAGADDPAFAAKAFSFDGGDLFRYDTTQETWMQAFHKDNAILSCILGGYYPAGGTGGFWGNWGDAAGANQTGALLAPNAGKPRLIILNASSTVRDVTADTAMTADAWNIVGLSLNEAIGAGGAFFYQNGAYNQVSGSDTFSSTYSSPAAGNSPNDFEIGARGDGATGDQFSSGWKISFIAFWDTALTKANFDALYRQLRQRF